jgi:D-alanyl-D-alanine carboxypeptidase/D-alanyl-D-alanine-endopeptidase (penicillin-binding protein 4)
VRRRLAILVALVVAALGVVAPGGADAANLQSVVAAALRGSTASAMSVAVAADGLGPAVDIGGSSALPPASTQKLYTVATALLVLGADHRFTTSLLRTASPPVDGVLAGDLVLRGSGDPTLDGSALNDLGAAVVAAGITHVTGSVWADDTRFDRRRGAEGWKSSYVPDESGPLSAVVVDHNVWRRDPAFVADPATPGAGRLRVLLQQAGVVIDGPDRLGSPDTGGASLETVAVHESAPLAAIIGPLLKSSDNMAAELLLKELGTTVGEGSSAAGVEAVWRQAAAFGLGRGRTTDGSGLSGVDRETAWHEVSWLLEVSKTPVADMFRTSLALACGDGTLKNRFCATPAAGQVFAKTGTLPKVVTLAGYTTTASGRRVWFSFLLSGVTSGAKARAAIDRSVNAIVTYRG